MGFGAVVAVVFAALAFLFPTGELSPVDVLTVLEIDEVGGLAEVGRVAGRDRPEALVPVLLDSIAFAVSFG